MMRRDRWRIVLGAVSVALLAGCGGSGTSSLTTDGGGSLIGDSGSSASTTDGAPGAGIFGRLVDESEQPVPDTEVLLLDASGTALAEATRTDANGDFQFTLSTEEVPEGARLVFHPPGRPETMASLGGPHGGRLDVVVRLGDQGQATIETILRAPRDAPRLGPDPDDPVALLLDAEGTSAAFRVEVRGRFDPGSGDVALVFHHGSGGWQIGGHAGRAETVSEVSLSLGRTALELHGRTIEVRALAGPPGSLAAGGMVRRLGDLPDGVVVSPDRVRAVVVATRDQRVAAGVIEPNAIVVGGGRTGVALVATADLAALGVRSGQRVALSTGTGRAEVTLEGSDDARLAAVTLILDDAAASALGLDLARDHAGYRIGLRAAD